MEVYEFLFLMLFSIFQLSLKEEHDGHVSKRLFTATITGSKSKK